MNSKEISYNTKEFYMDLLRIVSYTIDNKTQYAD
jgi:hypothetical protein